MFFRTGLVRIPEGDLAIDPRTERVRIHVATFGEGGECQVRDRLFDSGGAAAPSQSLPVARLRFMVASLLIYVGGVLSIAGLVARAVPRRWLPRARARWLVIVAAGLALAFIGFILPARDIVARDRRQQLDAIMPRYLFHERHALAVAASPAEVDRAIRAVTPEDIRFYRALTWIRRAGRRGPESLINAPDGVAMISLATRTGFHLLVDDPGREIVLGVSGPVSRAARARHAQGLHRSFMLAADGYVTIAMNFRIEADGRGGSIVSTETRVFAPDRETRRRLATYWRLILPGSALIRREWLDAIRRRAERRQT